MPREFTYDPDCKKLAEKFLSDAGKDFRLIPDLAQRIQSTIEDYLATEAVVGE